MTEPAAEPKLPSMITNDLEVTVAARGAAVAEPDLAIRVRGLRKSYDGAVQALDGANPAVRRGARRHPRGPPRRAPRRARPQRGGQDDARRDPRGPPQRRQRRGGGARPRPI